MSFRPHILHALRLVLALAFVACGNPDRDATPAAAPDTARVSSDPRPAGLPATAKWKRQREIQAFRDRPLHASDGGGRAWLERSDAQQPYAVSATPDRFEFGFEVGPLGIATGGALYFQLPGVGGWSVPQSSRPLARGYTTVEAAAPDLEFEIGPGPLEKAISIRVRGRALRAGERIAIHYGAGPAMALADRYAERSARFGFAVDGDGDGNYAYLADLPRIDVRSGPAHAIVASLPSTARSGEPIELRIALLDKHRNAGPTFAGPVRLRSVPAGLVLADGATLVDGHVRVAGSTGPAGVYRVQVEAGPLHAITNPLLVSPDAPRVLWGDLHGHSSFSDGTGLPEDYFRYARDTAGLDEVALTDHDHLGEVLLDERPQLWEQIAREVERFHEPGRFVTLLGYEWTSWIYGHRHVLYFGESGPLHSVMDPATATPGGLWAALRGDAVDALTFAHHSAGGPIATDWAIAPDPHFEPVTEISSIHGHSEAADAPRPIVNPVAGNFVRDALDRGYRLGFIGSGDTHDGHPGVTQLGYPAGGLAAIFSADLTRSGVLQALRARHVYATSGARILMQVDWNGAPLGATIGVGPEAGDGVLAIWIVATAPLDRVDIVRSGAVVSSFEGAGELEYRARPELVGLTPGEYLYVRGVQSDGATAWSSPFFFESDR